MQQTIKLSDNTTIPMLGLGTWKSAPNQVGDAVRFAIIKAGYRHIDCARVYNNEKEIGEVFKDVIGTAIKREELFVTGKLWNTEHRAELVEKACKNTLADLKLDYLDLYLMHWGVGFAPTDDGFYPYDKDGLIRPDYVSIQETWQAMEGLVKKGLVKAIGVANFTGPMIFDLLSYAKIKPVMNQIEMHPYNTQAKLVAFCQKLAIALTAYAPLGRPGMVESASRIIEEPIVKKIAQKYHKSPAQIVLNWALLRKTIVIPKSVTPERLKENSEIFDFELTATEQEEIASLNRNLRFVNPGETWGIPYFS